MNDIAKFFFVWFMLPIIIMGAVASLGRWLVANNRVTDNTAQITTSGVPSENPNVQTNVKPGSGVTVTRYTQESKPQ